jgi:hypothetical protein
MKKLILLSLIFILMLALLIFGKKSISTEITINAPADKVWEELTDFSKYPDWNPFLKKVTGEIKKGSKIEAEFHTKGQKPMVFTPVILILDKNRILQWEGQLFIPGIFTGKHTFELIEIEKNKTKLVQQEEFKGILVSFFNFQSTIDGFELMNKAFKERVEKK